MKDYKELTDRLWKAQEDFRDRNMFMEANLYVEAADAISSLAFRLCALEHKMELRTMRVYRKS